MISCHFLITLIDGNPFLVMKLPVPKTLFHSEILTLASIIQIYLMCGKERWRGPKANLPTHNSNYYREPLLIDNMENLIICFRDGLTSRLDE